MSLLLSSTLSQLCSVRSVRPGPCVWRRAETLSTPPLPLPGGGAGRFSCALRCLDITVLREAPMKCECVKKNKKRQSSRYTHCSSLSHVCPVSEQLMSVLLPEAHRQTVRRGKPGGGPPKEDLGKNWHFSITIIHPLERPINVQYSTPLLSQ